MKRIRRFKNDPLQIIGSIITVVGLCFIAWPLWKAYSDKTAVNFSFFGLFTGRPALITWLVIIAVGLILVLITKPLVPKQKSLEELEKKFEGEGRVLIRPSGTEPLVRVMIEGKDIEQMRADAEKLAQIIERNLM